MNRNLMPKSIDILNYWAKVLINEYGKFWLDIAFEKDTKASEKTAVCFACGSHVGTQRCHIIAHNNGGSHDASNLHLLCPECHIESENISEAELYFEWFKYKNTLNSGSALRLQNLANLYAALANNGNVGILPSHMKRFICLLQ